MLAAQKQEELPSLKQALSLAEAARAELDPHLPCSVRGFMLCPAKIRSMRVKVMLAVQRLLVREEQHSGFHSRSAMSLLAVLRLHAETRVGSFADSPEEARGECWVYDEEETSAAIWSGAAGCLRTASRSRISGPDFTVWIFHK